MITAGLLAVLTAAAPPRLVVVIAVDQLRADYLAALPSLVWARWLQPAAPRGGRCSPQARYEHVITRDLPGPRGDAHRELRDVNGIVANVWYDPVRERPQYCCVEAGP